MVLLGDSFTGKTSLVLRFAEGYYRESARSATVGAFFITKRLTVPSVGLTCKLQIWDTAGQEQFKPLAPMYYQSAAAAIVCYDPSNPKSMETLKYWLDELHKNVPAGRIVIAMAACKCDLLSSSSAAPQTIHSSADHTASTSTIPVSNTAKSVHNTINKQAAAASLQEVEDLAAQMGAIFVPTSAKTNENVTELFSVVAERVLQFQKQGHTSIPVTMGGGGSSPTQHTSNPQHDSHRPISPSNHRHIHSQQHRYQSHHHPSTPPQPSQNKNSNGYPHSAAAAMETPPAPPFGDPQHPDSPNANSNMSREEYLHRRNHHPESPTRHGSNLPKTSSVGLDGSPIILASPKPTTNEKTTLGGMAGLAASATMCGDADYLNCAVGSDGGMLLGEKCVIL